MDVKPIPGVQNYQVGSATESADQGRRERQKSEDPLKKKNKSEKAKGQTIKENLNDINTATPDSPKTESLESDISRQPVDSGKMVELLSKTQGTPPQNKQSMRPFTAVKELSNSIPTKKVNRVF
jgi:hypothetical protein